MITNIDPQPIAGLQGWRAAHVPSTGSTNTDLLTLAKSGVDVDRVWLTAGEQLDGKGRRGRSWVSPQGNLHASLYLSNPAPIADIGFLPLVCAVAVHRAFVLALGDKSNKVEIKWPNDVLIDDAKCCGILLESNQSRDHIGVVLGCGINLVAHPDNTPYPTTDLSGLGAPTSSETMFQYLAESFALTLDEWGFGNGKLAIRDYWLANARGIGQSITVNLGPNRLDGIFEGIDANGFLMLREPSGKMHEISAGDVFFPHLHN